MVDIGNSGHVRSGSSTGSAAVDDEPDVEDAFGEYDGDTVEIEKDALTLAEELKEEMGHAVAEDMETELGREERRVSKSDEAAASDDVDEADGESGAETGTPPKASELADLLGRSEEVEALGRRLQSEGMKEPGEILHYVRENLGEKPGEGGPSHDPTLQYGALAMIEKMFAASGDKEMASAVGAAASQLLLEHPTEINRGMIVTDAAALYASERCGTVSDLRALYMDHVVTPKGIPASFTGIVDKYGEAGFGEAVGFLLRAAGDDLATMTSSADRAQHKEVLDNLYQLEVLNTVRERTDGALATIGRAYPLAPDITPQRVMSETFAMIEHPVRMTEATVTRMAHDTVPGPVEGRIAFLREYRGLAAMIPIKVFDEADQGGGGGVRLRERLGDAIVAAQDVADAEEQEKQAAS